MLLLHRVRGDELVRGPVDGPRDEAFVERFPEELLRLEARLPESLGHDVHRDSPLRLQPIRELDDGPLPTPLSHADRDRDDARDGRVGTVDVQEERDVEEQDAEAKAEAEGKTATR